MFNDVWYFDVRCRSNGLCKNICANLFMDGDSASFGRTVLLAVHKKEEVTK